MLDGLTITYNFHPLQTSFLRLQGYPAGLGKGHDAAVVSAWLDEELVHTPPTFAEVRLPQ